jgi:hypothetical protein
MFGDALAPLRLGIWSTSGQNFFPGESLLCRSKKVILQWDKNIFFPFHHPSSSLTSTLFVYSAAVDLLGNGGRLVARHFYVLAFVHCWWRALVIIIHSVGFYSPPPSPVHWLALMSFLTGDWVVEQYGCCISN